MKSVLRNYGLGCIKNFVFSFKKFLMNIEVFFSNLVIYIRVSCGKTPLNSS